MKFDSINTRMKNIKHVVFPVWLLLAGTEIKIKKTLLEQVLWEGQCIL